MSAVSALVLTLALCSKSHNFRVSTVEQNDGRQIEGLKKYNIDKTFSEKVSAKDTNRPELKSMIEFARENDTIYIHSLDRLARSTKDLLNIVDQLQSKGIHLVSRKEAIDTNTATGKLMLTMIGAINTFERENMLERQREGIAIAVKNGAYKGRKEIDYPSNWVVVYNKYKNRELKANEAMLQLDLKRTTFYKLIKQYEGR
ncbi:MAG TPA: recombinase family protein [Clostridium sp.]|uniref:recombinase family protein n=1 Tax=Clostridium sp. TaxID=1506 RepID=UPI002F937FC7